MGITASSAEDFAFDSAEFFGSEVSTHNTEGVKTAEGGLLVLDQDGRIGKEQFCKSVKQFAEMFFKTSHQSFPISSALFDMEGVQPSLISRPWVYNHYKWIVYKLAAMEVCFPHDLSKKYEIIIHLCLFVFSSFFTYSA